jgi:hypothetical protein
MKKITYYLILFGAMCTNGFVMAQAIPDSSFYPLQVGNAWQYRFSPHDPIYTMRVIGDTVMPNGKKYCAVERHFNFPESFYPQIQYERIDSNGTTWFYDSTSTTELTMEEFSLPVGTPWTSYRKSDIGDPAKITWSGKLLTELSGDSLVVTRVDYTFRYGEDTAIRFARGIGIIWEEFELRGPMTLTGATVNNKVYGTLVAVGDRFDVAVPSTFSLSQNFPNPFNPTTTIWYVIPSRALVSLKVYNLLGREVRTLVQQVQGPGRYSASFEAEHLPSGVYFYRLMCGIQSTTKPMLLLK